MLLKSAICENGHLQTTTLKNNEKFSNNYCIKCGSKIIDACPHCNTPILGGYGFTQKEKNLYFEVIGFKFIREPKHYKEPPYYCHNCGKPYPWTQKFLENYQQLLDLYDDEIDNSLNQLIYSTTEKLLKDSFSTSSINAVILKKCFTKLSDITNGVLINAISSFAGDIIKNYLSSSE